MTFTYMLISYSYVNRLITNDKFMFVDIIKSLMKYKSIVVTSKKHNEKIVRYTH